MNRLINADALQMQIDEYAEHIRRLKKGKIPKAELAVLLDCKACVDNAPTVDAVPVVHGEWIDRNGSIVAPFWERYECSECGARSDNSKYCPNCGARMDADETES